METIQGDLLRETYYGDGEQVIGIIIKQGWGPDFAAACVVKYFRRDKRGPETDLAKAQWYFSLLQDLSIKRRYALDCIRKLREEILTPEEFSLLTKMSME